METQKFKIEIDKDVLITLNGYCKKNDISINEFIKTNLEAIGEY